MEVSRFVLIPESDYLKHNAQHSARDHVILDPNIVEKSKILPTLPKVSFVNKIQKPIASVPPSPATHQNTVHAKIPNQQFEKLVREQTQMKNRAEIILDRIRQNPRVDISEADQVIVDGEKLPLNIGTFLSKLQLTSNTKIQKRDLDLIINLIDTLDIPEHLMKNKYLARKAREFRDTQILNYTLPEIKEEKYHENWQRKPRRKSKQKAWTTFLDQTKEEISDYSSAED